MWHVDSKIETTCHFFCTKIRKILTNGKYFFVFDLAICKYYTVYSQPYIFKMNKNKCRIHLTNTTDIKGGKNEKKIS